MFWEPEDEEVPQDVKKTRDRRALGLLTSDDAIAHMIAQGVREPEPEDPYPQARSEHRLPASLYPITIPSRNFI